MIKKIAIGLLALFNSALIIMIIVSVATGWHFRTKPSESSDIIAESSLNLTSSHEDDEKNSEEDDDDDDDYDDDSEYSYDDNDDGEFDADNDFVAGVTVESIPEEDDVIEESQQSQNSEPAQTSSTPVQESKPVQTSKPTQTSKPAQTSEPTQTSKPAQTSKPTQTSKPAQTSKPTQTSKPAQSTFPSADSMSTSDKAGIMDAEGYSWDKGWTYLSSNAKQISDYSLLTGGWKATMITDPFELMDSYATDYFNVSFSGSATSAKVTMNWGLRILKSVGTVDDTGSTSSMAGKFSGGKLTAVGSGSIEITGFFYDNGKEFAVGTYTWPDGVIGYIGLIRP